LLKRQTIMFQSTIYKITLPHQQNHLKLSVKCIPITLNQIHLPARRCEGPGVNKSRGAGF
jgi:hypothetical protein